MTFVKISFIKKHVEKDLRITLIFCKNYAFQLSHGIKKHLSKQVIPLTKTLEKKFLQLLLSIVCESLLFRQSKKM